MSRCNLREPCLYDAIQFRAHLGKPVSKPSKKRDMSLERRALERS